MKQFVPLPNSAGCITKPRRWSVIVLIRGRCALTTSSPTTKQLNAYYYFDDDYLAKPFAKFEAGGAALPGFGDLTNETLSATQT